MPKVADYVVVGTGSAGAVVASKLSAEPRSRVVVLEAGPKDKDKFIHIPAAFSKLFRSRHDWDYLTEPQPELNGRQIFWPRGKMLGGSSSMMAMMWIRGFAADYDDWAAHARTSPSTSNASRTSRGRRRPTKVSTARPERCSGRHHTLGSDPGGCREDDVRPRPPRGGIRGDASCCRRRRRTCGGGHSAI